jgi:hypothetical protein
VRLPPRPGVDHLTRLLPVRSRARKRAPALVPGIVLAGIPVLLACGKK